jgi:hypothetical protein
MSSLRASCRDHSRYVVGCAACRTANAARKRARHRLIAYGQWEGDTDAGPVRDHLALLAASGITRDTIVRLSGVGKSTLSSIAAGQPTVRAVTAQAVLGVRAAPAPTARVSAAGAIRRLQALTAIGWDAHSLAARLDVQVQQVWHWRSGLYQRVSYRHHQRISALYRVLENRPGPSESSRARAQSLGYVPPIHWDGDGHLDDPNARPKVFKSNPLHPSATNRKAA